MSGAQILMLVLMLTLPLSALLARRPPLGQTVKFAAAWVVLFAIATIVVTQFDRLRRGGGDSATTSGQSVRLVRNSDGHYWADVRINGVARQMLIDTGASTTALSEATATAAGLDLDGSMFPRLIDTANGQVTARTARVERMVIGAIETRDLPVVVSPAFGDQDLIGMNFLSRLGSWRVEGDALILTPPSDEI